MMRGKTTTCTALVAWALLFLLPGLIAADDAEYACSAEAEVCYADPQCEECRTTSLCDFVTSDTATCADIETTVCCTVDAIEVCRNNEDYLALGECFFGAFVGCDLDGMSISDYCGVGEVQADSGAPGIAPAPAHGLATAVAAAGVVVAASGFMS